MEWAEFVSRCAFAALVLIGVVALAIRNARYNQKLSLPDPIWPVCPVCQKRAPLGRCRNSSGLHCAKCCRRVKTSFEEAYDGEVATHANNWTYVPDPDLDGGEESS